MARMSLTLPPGFRFHPTDVELVMYYLKRKVMGKKLHFEAISEINIHNFAPWDLPDKACLKGKDLEWFFFCPIEKKYASGFRVKRATDNGYWKITGKDRNVFYNDKIVGTVKTLVFHLGQAPFGKRTDWIIHEYRIIDEELAATGAQDNYVLCKVFKKNGLGPRNGSFVGALFDEADWASDDIDIAQNHIISSQCNGPTFALVLPEKQSPSVGPGINDPGSISAYCPLFPMGPSTSQVLVDEPDAEMERLLGWFLDCNVNNTMLPLNDNGNLEADLIGKGKNIVVPGFDGNDTNTSTDVQAYQTQMNECGIDFSRVMQKDGLVAPLNFSAVGGTGTEQFQMCDRVGSYFNEKMEGGNLSYAAHYASCMGQLPLLPEESEIEGFLNMAQLENGNYYHESNAPYASDFLSQPHVPPEESNMADSFLNVVQMENDNYYHGSNATCGLDTSYRQLHDGGLYYQDMETGEYDDNQ
ncbi:uncharacterized protein [Primulina huaijiensis]|uniref:uncharacterized protein n=1 Tax=Primulina huaijiensis TaxID=1492673 RepID=UPI003CC74553